MTTIKCCEELLEELPQVSQEESVSLDSVLTRDKLDQGLTVTPVTSTDGSGTLLDLFTWCLRTRFLPVSGHRFSAFSAAQEWRSGLT